MTAMLEILNRLTCPECGKRMHVLDESPTMFAQQAYYYMAAKCVCGCKMQAEPKINAEEALTDLMRAVASYTASNTSTQSTTGEGDHTLPYAAHTATP